jgi:hypothetical protein
MLGRPIPRLLGIVSHAGEREIIKELKMCSPLGRKGSDGEFFLFRMYAVTLAQVVWIMKKAIFYF